MLHQEGLKEEPRPVCVTLVWLLASLDLCVPELQVERFLHGGTW